MHRTLRVLPLVAVALWACFPSPLSGAELKASYHHVHLNAADPAAAAAWYAKHLGGEATQVGPFAAVDYGKMKLIFFKGKTPFEGSVGSSVDHIGFSFPDLEAKMRELGAAGVEIVSGVEQEGPIKYAFIRDPNGTLIETVQDPDIQQGFHHVHLATTDVRATLGWYVESFGGEITRFAGILPGVRYGDVWVLAKKVDSQRAPTKGRAIDHLSWGFADLDAAAEKLKSQGVKFVSGPYSFGTSRIAFVEAPDGVLIELVGPGPKR